MLQAARSQILVLAAVCAFAPASSSWRGITPAVERCAGETIELLQTPNARTPFVRLEVDGRSGPFLLDYGATRSSLAAVGASGNGARVRIASFSLPSFGEGRFGVRPRLGNGERLGVIGTDLLSRLTADFDFRDGGGDVVFSERPCDRATLGRRGMIAISQNGFFSSDYSRVRAGMPNVPIVWLRIGPVAVWAQIDTGYDDSVLPPSIDINDRLYEKLVAAGVAMKKSNSIDVRTCAGVETRAVYRVDDVAIAALGGRDIQRLEGVSLLRKPSSVCGGIAMMDEPAAQIGISALRQLGGIVFDPKSEMVWVAPKSR